MIFSFSRGDVRQDELTAESTVREYASKLCVEYSTGAKQVCEDLVPSNYYLQGYSNVYDCIEDILMNYHNIYSKIWHENNNIA